MSIAIISSAFVFGAVYGFIAGYVLGRSGEDE